MWTPTLTDSEQPRYLALVEAITLAIETGELKVGERLPPQRRLAWNLGLNPSTTMQAYREAARRHLVSGEVGRGTYVLAGSKEATLFRLKQPAERPALVDLSTNVPAVDDASQDEALALGRMIESGHTARLSGYLNADDLLLASAQGSAWHPAGRTGPHGQGHGCQGRGTDPHLAEPDIGHPVCAKAKRNCRGGEATRSAGDRGRCIRRTDQQPAPGQRPGQTRSADHQPVKNGGGRAAGRMDRCRS